MSLREIWQLIRPDPAPASKRPWIRETLRDIFNSLKPTADKALGRAVKKNDLEGVRKAFRNGANPNAMCSVWGDEWNSGVFGSFQRMPVLWCALHSANGAVFQEILEHKPDLKIGNWDVLQAATSLSNSSYWRERIMDVKSKNEMAQNYAKGLPISPPPSEPMAKWVMKRWK